LNTVDLASKKNMRRSTKGGDMWKLKKKLVGERGEKKVAAASESLRMVKRKKEEGTKE